jgi:hypothetical protein
MGNWTPSIVPTGEDQSVYLVVDDFGDHGRCWLARARGSATVDAAAGMSGRQTPPPSEKYEGKPTNESAACLLGKPRGSYVVALQSGPFSK